MRIQRCIIELVCIFKSEKEKESVIYGYNQGQMTGEKYENYTKIVMNDEKDRSSGQNSKSDQYITICHKDGK